jgi:hypothetical protein
MWEVFATFKGKNAHAAGEPHLGINALDAGVQAYVNISTLRQQLKPECRVHGIFLEGGQRPNIIPDRCVLHYYVRAPDKVELFSLIERVTKCFEAAALATGCTVSLEWPAEPFLDIQSNSVLAEQWGKHFEQLTGAKLPGAHEETEGLGSTDMGNVTYEVPGLHPCYSITDGTGCHTAGFADAAVTEHSHNQTLFAAKSMFLASLDVMTDAKLLAKMKAEFAAAEGARRRCAVGERTSEDFTMQQQEMSSRMNLRSLSCACVLALIVLLLYFQLSRWLALLSTASHSHANTRRMFQMRQSICYGIRLLWSVVDIGTRSSQRCARPSSTSASSTCRPTRCAQCAAL